jgi:hypothetical protein
MARRVIERELGSTGAKSRVWSYLHIPGRSELTPEGVLFTSPGGVKRSESEVARKAGDESY